LFAAKRGIAARCGGVASRTGHVLACRFVRTSLIGSRS
jgi:hypothetical protein